MTGTEAFAAFQRGEVTEDIRLTVLRLRWMGMDVGEGVDETDFAVAYWAVTTYAKPDGGTDRWIVDAEAGQVNPYVREHDLMIAGWRGCVECWNRGRLAPSEYADVEAALWPLVDARPDLNGVPNLALWGEAWRKVR